MNGSKTEVLLWLIAEMIWAYMFYDRKSIEYRDTLIQTRAKIDMVEKMP